MIEQLNKILPEVNLYQGSFVNTRPLMPLVDLARILPANSQGSKDLHRYIDDEPTYHFFSEYIYMVVEHETKYEDGKNLMLSDLPSFADIPFASHHLVNELVSLPWSYRVFYPLWGDAAKLMPSATDEMVLSPTTRLLRISENNVSEFPKAPEHKENNLGPLFGSLFGSTADRLSIGRVVFVTEVEGFIGRFAGSEPLRRAESRLRSFFGLCLALGLLEKGSSYMPSPPKQHLLVERTDQGSKVLERAYELDDEFNLAISKFQPFTFTQKFDGETMELWRTTRLTLIRSAFKYSASSHKLQLAARWHFDSVANSGELLAFVQAMICLEIILGEQSEASELGVGEAIRNRCAYLIGKSTGDRDQIIDDLKDIYRVRSKIVHTGKENLSAAERRMMMRLRQICSLVLNRELELETQE
ncbi:HEPN domain-containing protein [Devosia sp. 919]|uniref:HEPN domain-containing protein n=1 Tax=Devosia sp. 919 TaxID=2726065 RepID=UPI0015582464|nr:HEPN domain-containing protein [Devosia sp. 919]